MRRKIRPLGAFHRPTQLFKGLVRTFALDTPRLKGGALGRQFCFTLGVHRSTARKPKKLRRALPRLHRIKCQGSESTQWKGHGEPLTTL
jgi:hypothetical protein